MKKVSFNDFLDVYDAVANKTSQLENNPVAHIDTDNNIVAIEFFLNGGTFKHIVDAVDELKHEEYGEYDYWDILSSDVDINVYSFNGDINVSLYHFKDGLIDTTNTSMEGIRCNTKKL